MIREKSTDYSVWRRLSELARPNWPHLLGIVLLSFLSTPLSLLMPLPLKISVDSVLGNQALPNWLQAIIPDALEASKRNALFVAGGLLLVIAILASLQSLASWLLQTYTGEKLVHNLRAQLLWHVQRVSLAFHDRRGPSDTSYRIQHDAPAVQNILIHGLVPMVTSGFGFFAMLFVTLRISPKLAVIALLLSPVLFLLARHSSRRVRAAMTPACACASCQTTRVTLSWRSGFPPVPRSRSASRRRETARPIR